MDTIEISSLKKNEIALIKGIGENLIEIENAIFYQAELEMEIESVIKNVETRDPKLISLSEYRKMRLEVVQKYKKLAINGLVIRKLNKKVKDLWKNLQSTQEFLYSLQRKAC